MDHIVVRYMRSIPKINYQLCKKCRFMELSVNERGDLVGKMELDDPEDAFAELWINIPHDVIREAIKMAGGVLEDA